MESVSSVHALAATKKEEVKKLNQKLQFLLDSYVDQVIDRDDYLKRKAILMSEKKTLEEQEFLLRQGQNQWLEPLKNWITDTSNVTNIAIGTDLFAKKVMAQKIYGSNLTLKNETARGEASGAWAALCAAPTSRNMVPRTGFEPVIC